MSDNKNFHAIPLQDIQIMAEAVYKSGLYPEIRSPEAALVLMLISQSEGSHPMRAMQTYHIVKGKPSKRADAILAEFQARGGIVDWPTMDHKQCTAVFEAPGIKNPLPMTWTIDDAKNANLSSNDQWRRFPRAMLRARVISEGVRSSMPGVIAGFYTPEEVADFDEPISSKQQTAKQKWQGLRATPQLEVIDGEMIISESTPAVDATSEILFVKEHAMPEESEIGEFASLGGTVKFLQTEPTHCEAAFSLPGVKEYLHLTLTYDGARKLGVVNGSEKESDTASILKDYVARRGIGIMLDRKDADEQAPEAKKIVKLSMPRPGCDSLPDDIIDANRKLGDYRGRPMHTWSHRELTLANEILSTMARGARDNDNKLALLAYAAIVQKFSMQAAAAG